MRYSESLGRALGALADPLHEPVLLAFPVFITFVAIEWISARVLEAREPGGYRRGTPSPRSSWERARRRSGWSES